LADVLFGKYNPAGRLSTTWYSADTVLPPMADYDVRKGRTYLYFQGAPLYPFGHGLSYTSFLYEHLTVTPNSVAQGDEATVTFDVQNVGVMAGDEVVQLYVHDGASTVDRPTQALRGFERVTLAPGEGKMVKMPIRTEDLALWDATTHSWRVEAGPYELRV